MIMTAELRIDKRSLWTIYVPQKNIGAGLEIGIVVSLEGVKIGGHLLPWSEIDKDRAALSVECDE